MKGLVFDIKEFALNDGDGIRTTVFLKGCPLRCIWCHNPEGLSHHKELYINSNGCTNCKLCLQPCLHDDCAGFDRCLHICPQNLIRVSGIEWDSEKLIEKFLNQKQFFDTVNGGITLSGGEPLSQLNFCVEVLNGLKGKIHRAVETCGYSSEKDFISLISRCDLVFMDIKLAQEDQHILYTGVSNKNILRNVRLLKESGIPHIFRTPLIPNITDTEENLTQISQIVGSDVIELLPYNTLAGAKYKGVGRSFTNKINENSKKEYEPKKLISMFKNAKLKK